MTGSALPKHKIDWPAKASKVVGRTKVEEDFELFSSVYHFPGYVPESRLGTEEKERIQDELRRGTVFFEAGKSVVRAEEARKVSALAKAMLGFGDSENYVIGILSSKEADSAVTMNLWADRVEAVMRLLIGYGMRYEQFEVVDFSPLREGGRDNGVEILLK